MRIEYYLLYQLYINTMIFIIITTTIDIIITTTTP